MSKTSKNLTMALAILVLLGVGGIFIERKLRQKVASPGSKLNRPLVVGLTSWPGYAGGIVANGGFRPNNENIYFRKYGLEIQFLLIEDVDARGKAFAKGGPDGID